MNDTEEKERSKWLAELLRQFEAIRWPLGIASPDAVRAVQYAGVHHKMACVSIAEFIEGKA
jgi:hypothetical protein